MGPPADIWDPMSFTYEFDSPGLVGADDDLSGSNCPVYETSPNLDLSFLESEFACESSLQTVDPILSDPSLLVPVVVSPPDTPTTISLQHSHAPATTTVSAITPPATQVITTPIIKPLPLKSRDPKPNRKALNSYPCPECSLVTSNMKDLGNHVRDIHKLQAFKCPNCDTRVARYDNLSSHKKSCKRPPAHVAKRPASAPNSPTEPRRRRRHRVSFLDLQPALRQPPPQATSPHRSTPKGLEPPDSSPPQNGGPDLPQQSKIPQLLSEGSTILANTAPPRTAADWALEVETLRAELEKTKKGAARVSEELEDVRWECKKWRGDFRRLEQGGRC